MSIPFLSSVAMASIAALLSIVMLFQGGSNLALQTELQKRTQTIQTQQQEIQIQQQQLQAAEKQVNTASQLAKELGPQVIGSLKIVGMRTSNAKIFALLAKYGVQVTDEEKAQITKMIQDAKAKEGAKP